MSRVGGLRANSTDGRKWENPPFFSLSFWAEIKYEENPSPQTTNLTNKKKKCEESMRKDWTRENREGIAARRKSIRPTLFSLLFFSRMDCEKDRRKNSISFHWVKRIKFVSRWWLLIKHGTLSWRLEKRSQRSMIRPALFFISSCVFQQIYSLFCVCASLTVTLKVLGPRRAAKRCRRRQKGRRRMEQKGRRRRISSPRSLWMIHGQHGGAKIFF